MNKEIKISELNLRKIISEAEKIYRSAKKQREKEMSDDSDNQTFAQWEVTPKGFKAVGNVTRDLPAALYKLNVDNYGNVYFKQSSISTNELLRFNDSKIDEVAEHIDIFWKSKNKYKNFDVQYKRGILLYGPPGTGKSSIIKLLINDVISRDGIAISFDHPRVFMEGISILKRIHPNKPVVCIIEDLDTTMREWSTKLLDILDGSTVFLDNVIFVATTNYIERLEDRIKDRPSRFDKVIHVPYPNEDIRRAYIENLFNNAGKSSKRSIDKWVRDTDGFSFPHMTELFLGVHLYGRGEKDYKSVLESIKNMGDIIHSSDDGKKDTIGID